MTLFFDSGQQSIAVTTARDTNGLKFTPVTTGSDHITNGSMAITLSNFSFTNGSGPASSFSVTPGATISPEILGQFTYQVQGAGAVVPEPTSVLMLGTGVIGLLGYGWRRGRPGRA